MTDALGDLGELLREGGVAGEHEDLQPVISRKLAAELDQPAEHLFEGELFAGTIDQPKHVLVAGVQRRDDQVGAHQLAGY
ncbi:MAG: hypothetical protein ACOX1P_08180 [Thermoguttaceae bacterium]